MDETGKKARSTSKRTTGELLLAEKGAPSPSATEASERHTPEKLKIHKIFRIAVSGDVLLTKLEVSLVDTPAFQRLRRIRELGTVSLVYPTALHTRFDHCLGTLAMADRMVTAIRSNTHSDPEQRAVSEDEEILVRLYALLHDLTHIPFGHTLEDELGLFPRHDRIPPRIDWFWHRLRPSAL